MPQKSNRRRRPQVNNASAAPSSGQYAKYLPEWMKDGSTPPPRPRVRRAPRNRPAGGYTPGKFAVGNDPLSG
jgi:hypothetical protein